jgi:peroxiredoxin
MRRLLILLLFAVAFVPDVLGQESLPETVLNSEIRTLDGQSFRLTDTSPSAKILFVCASWARVCDFAVKDMNRFQRTYSARGVEIIGLTHESPASDEPKVRKFVRRNKIKFKIGWLNDEMEAALTDKQHPGLVPIVIILDSKQRIDSKFVGYSMWQTPNRIVAVLNRLKRT